MIERNISKSRPMISVVSPAYNEEANIPEMYERLVSVASQMPKYDFEFVFVDDCSTDHTPEVLSSLREKDRRIMTVRFSRNFGSHAGVTAGLNLCQGDGAIIMAADLQDPPEKLLPKMVEQWEKGFKVVWGVREKREGEGFATLLLSRFFYILSNLLTDVKQPKSGADVFFLDRTVIDAFNQTPEKNTSVIMLIAWLGFRQTSIDYVKEARHGGESKWTLPQKFKLFFDSLISFSYTPLRFMSLVGLLVALAGFIYGVDIARYALAHGTSVPGWSSLMIAVLMIGGMLMVMLGVLGEYLWRAYDESRGRPRYVIEKDSYSDNDFPPTDDK